MAKLGYARVSTAGQRIDGQWDALVAAGVEPDDIAIEYASGNADRPVLVRQVGRLESGDELVVWRLDRLGRNTRDLHELLGVLDQRGARLVSLTEGLDSGGLTGRLLVSLLIALAQWEREAVLERTAMGMRAARAKGIRFGRPPKLTPIEKRSALSYRQQGMSNTEIGRLLGCSRATVYRALLEVSGDGGE